MNAESTHYKYYSKLNPKFATENSKMLAATQEQSQSYTALHAFTHSRNGIRQFF